MVTYACEYCGGDLIFKEGDSIAECDSCGRRQPVPSAQDEHLQALFVRAGELRRKNAFDKAAGVYESIIAEDATQAKAYWGLLLCEYGIEYVEDPQSGERIPTCHRASYTNVLESPNYAGAIQYANGASKVLYERDAKALETLREAIIVKARTTDPVDVFICYKESNETGGRTLDSELAGRLYDRLTAEGLRVFFARETLKEHFGAEYEPLIFSALHSAKAMLVVTTSTAHVNATWVKNEWSRYLALMKADPKTTRRFTACIKGIDEEELPGEFLRYECADLSLPGVEDDLVRSLKKFFQETVPQNATAIASPTILTLLKRGNLELSYENFQKAGAIFDQTLNLNPECAEALLGATMAKYACKNREALRMKCLALVGDGEAILTFPYFKAAQRFVTGELKEWLDQIPAERTRLIKEDKERKRKEREKQEREERERKEREERKAREVRERREREEREEYEKRKRREREERERADRYSKAKSKLTEQIQALLKEWCIAHTEAVAPLRFVHANTTSVALLGMHEQGSICTALTCQTGGNSKPWIRKNVEALDCQAVGTKHLLLQLDGSILAVTETDEKTLDALPNFRMISATDDSVYGIDLEGNICQLNVGDLDDVVACWKHARPLRLFTGAGKMVAIGMGKNKVFTNSEPAKALSHLCSDILQVALGEGFVVYLRKYGVWGCLGTPPPGFTDELDVGAQLDVVSIAAGRNHAVFLTKDGRVHAVGDNHAGQCRVTDWQDCYAIFAAGDYTLALTRKGVFHCTDPGVKRALVSFCLPAEIFKEMYENITKQQKAEEIRLMSQLRRERRFHACLPLLELP